MSTEIEIELDAAGESVRVEAAARYFPAAGRNATALPALWTLLAPIRHPKMTPSPERPGVTAS